MCIRDRILIVDLDVHQGNGNSEIFKDNRSVFTFSMHSKTNYPAKKSNSDLDVELDDNLEDDAYIKTCLLYTSPSPRDKRQSRMPSSA